MSVKFLQQSLKYKSKNDLNNLKKKRAILFSIKLSIKTKIKKEILKYIKMYKFQELEANLYENENL
jgi:hypothetical protein